MIRRWQTKKTGVPTNSLNVISCFVSVSRALTNLDSRDHEANVTSNQANVQDIALLKCEMLFSSFFILQHECA